MITSIKRIEHKTWYGKEKHLIFFDYQGKEQYTEYNEKVLGYWRKYFNNPNFIFAQGMKINVFRVPNTKLYTIKMVEA